MKIAIGAVFHGYELRKHRAAKAGWHYVQGVAYQQKKSYLDYKMSCVDRQVSPRNRSRNATVQEFGSRTDARGSESDAPPPMTERCEEKACEYKGWQIKDAGWFACNGS